MRTKQQWMGGIRPRLMALFLLSSLLPLGLTGWMAIQWTSEAIGTASHARLTSTLEIKKQHLKQYFTQRRQEMEMLTHGTYLAYHQRLQKLVALRDFYGETVKNRFHEWRRATELFAATKPLAQNLISIDWVFRRAGGTPAVLTSTRGERWRTLATMIRPRLETFREKYGFDNVYMISSRGNVVLTAVPEKSVGHNVKTDPWKKSVLGELFVRAAKQTVFQDFQPFDLLDGQLAGWIATPLHAEKDDALAGILLARLSPGMFEKIKSQLNTMEKSVNLYLVEPNQWMHTSASLAAQAATTPAPITPAPTTHTDVAPAAIQAMRPAATGAGLRYGPDNQTLLAAWAPLSLLPMVPPPSQASTWGVVAELPMEHLFSSSPDKETTLYKKQMEISGYYDFFLIRPDGEVFYSATHQADFGTNLLTGPYAGTNLGQLVRQVQETTQFALTDFSPYPPSHNEPAAFIAQPLINDGKVVMIVALQLPLESLTATMQKERGHPQDDAYLVGPDKRMRSDSLLDPKNHSVIASFAGQVADHGADTPPVRLALEGKTGILPGDSFAGHPVLTAYTPLAVSDNLTWAVITETPYMEKGVAMHVVPTPLLLTAGGSVSLCLLIGWMTTTGARRAVLHCVRQLQPLYNGKLAAPDQTTTRTLDRDDELGILSHELGAVVIRWHKALGRVQTATRHTVVYGMELAKMATRISRHVETHHAEHLDDKTSAIQEIADHNQQQLQDAKLLEAWLSSVEHDALQGKHAIASAASYAREITEKSVDFVEIAKQTNQLTMKAAMDLAGGGKHDTEASSVIVEIRRLTEKSRILADEMGELSLATVQTVENAEGVLAACAPGVKKSMDLARTMTITPSQHTYRSLEQMRTIAQQLKQCHQEQADALENMTPMAQKFSRKLAVMQKELAFFKVAENRTSGTQQG